MKRNLEATLQALYNSEINVTITMLWDGGIDFAFISSMNFVDLAAGTWHHVDRFNQLADALHQLALLEYPTSAYALRATA